MPGVKGRSGGHNAKTTAQHHADGTFEKRRHGKRADNTPAKGSPTKPTGLTKEQSEVWDYLAKHLPANVVGVKDTIMLSEACDWYRRYKDACVLYEQIAATGDAKEARSAFMNAKGCWDEFRKIALDFGVTPVSRARVKAESGDGDGKKTPGGALADLIRLRGSNN